MTWNVRFSANLALNYQIFRKSLFIYKFLGTIMPPLCFRLDTPLSPILRESSIFSTLHVKKWLSVIFIKNGISVLLSFELFDFSSLAQFSLAQKFHIIRILPANKFWVFSYPKYSILGRILGLSHLPAPWLPHPISSSISWGG